MCGCGGPEAINIPETGDLIAIIHPVTYDLTTSMTIPISTKSTNTPCRSRSRSRSRGSSMSSISSLSSSSSAPSSIISMAIPTPTAKSRSSSFTGARLTLSNRVPGATISSFTLTKPLRSHPHHPSGSEEDSSFDNNNDNIQIHIHRFGFPLDIPTLANPITHSFVSSYTSCSSDTFQPSRGDESGESHGVLPERLDMSIGVRGVLGRTVSVCDGTGRVLGEGVLGRL